MNKDSNKRNNHILLIIGLLLSWLPFVAPTVFSITTLIMGGRFRFDYLMPAELFIFGFLGGVLISLVSYRINYLKKLTLSFFVTGILAFVLGQLVALIYAPVIESIPGQINWQIVTIIISLVIYSICNLSVAVFGLVIKRGKFS